MSTLRCLMTEGLRAMASTTVECESRRRRIASARSSFKALCLAANTRSSTNELAISSSILASGRSTEIGCGFVMPYLTARDITLFACRRCAVAFSSHGKRSHYGMDWFQIHRNAAAFSTNQIGESLSDLRRMNKYASCDCHRNLRGLGPKFAHNSDGKLSEFVCRRN